MVPVRRSSVWSYARSGVSARRSGSGDGTGGGGGVPFAGRPPVGVRAGRRGGARRGHVAHPPGRRGAGHRVDGVAVPGHEAGAGVVRLLGRATGPAGQLTELRLAHVPETAGEVEGGGGAVAAAYEGE